jgi:non-ribosomal peptide synthase protein (TIGR01720 family)
MLEVAGKRLEAGVLREVVEEIVKQHDALRMRYRRVAVEQRGQAGEATLNDEQVEQAAQDDRQGDEQQQEWQQWCALTASDYPAPVCLHLDLSSLSDVPQQQAQILSLTATQIQQSLNLQHGPVLRVALFEGGAEQRQQLLIAIHHLVVDGVSWRILLDDLQRGYEQAERGERVELGDKTTSYKQWAHRQAEWANSKGAREQRAYWLMEARRYTAATAGEGGGAGSSSGALSAVGEERNLVRNRRSVVHGLSREQTEAVLRQVPAVYRTQIDEVLLTALGRALAAWSGRADHAVELEGHGREEEAFLLRAGDDKREGENGNGRVDLSRTVGWFTSIYPVILHSPAEESVGAAIKRVKEQIRSVPARGVGYGALRYLSRDREVREQLRRLVRGEISFNYLGQLDQALREDGWLRGSALGAGESESRRAVRSHELEVNASVRGGRLEVAWSYGEGRIERARIEELAQRFEEALAEIIRHCREEEAGGYTPSDFPLAKIDQKQLDKIVSKVKRPKGHRSKGRS